MKKKALSVLLMTVMGAALLAGCGSSSGSGSTGADSAATTGAAEAGTETASASDGSALQVDIWDNNQLDGLQQIADEWTKTSGVPVKINVITWDQYWTLLEAVPPADRCRMCSGCTPIPHRCTWRTTCS